MPAFKPALGLLIILLTSCMTDKPVELLSMDSIQANGLGKTTRLGVKLRMDNPNSWGCRVVSTEADVFINDIRIGHSSLEKSFRMPSDTQFVAECSFDADLPAIAKVLPGMLMDPKHITAKISGTVVVSKFLIRKRYPFTIKQPIDREFLQRVF